MTTTVIASPTTPPQERPPLHMSYEAWLDWEYEGALTEWVNGKVIIHMSTTRTHQIIVEFLHLLIGTFVQLLQLGETHLAPYPMRSTPDGTGREPDLLFVSTENLHRISDKHLSGPADLVIEVVSDDSVARDHDEKFYEYERAGVREYWIIDPRPNRQRAFFYTLDAHGRYQPVPVGADNVFRSSVLAGFWLKTDWLWAEEPNALAALGEIVGAERMMQALRGA